MLCLLVLSCATYGQTAQKNRKVGFGFEVRFLNVDISSGRLEVDNIPKSMRTVPIHKDDGYLGSGRDVVVPSDRIKPGLLLSYAPVLAPEITFSDRLTLRGGAVVSVGILPTASASNHGTTREVHQYDSGTERGVGTSFVYYAVTASQRPHFGWLAESELSVTESLSVIGGYESSGNSLKINTGWDRYNKLQTYKNYDIGVLETKKQYFGFRAGSKRGGASLLVVVGHNSRNFNSAPAGKDIGVKTGGGFCFTTGVSYRIRR